MQATAASLYWDCLQTENKCERCPGLSDTSESEPLLLQLMGHSRMGGRERKLVHPSIVSMKFPYTAECNAHRTQLANFKEQDIAQCVSSNSTPIQNSPTYDTTQAVLLRSGYRDCKTQDWFMNMGKQRRSRHWKLVHGNL